MVDVGSTMPTAYRRALVGRPFEFELQVQLCMKPRPDAVQERDRQMAGERSPFVTVAKVRIGTDMSDDEQLLNAATRCPFTLGGSRRSMRHSVRSSESAKGSLRTLLESVRHRLNGQERREPRRRARGARQARRRLDTTPSPFSGKRCLPRGRFLALPEQAVGRGRRVLLRHLALAGRPGAAAQEAASSSDCSRCTQRAQIPTRATGASRRGEPGSTGQQCIDHASCLVTIHDPSRTQHQKDNSIRQNAQQVQAAHESSALCRRGRVPRAPTGLRAVSRSHGETTRSAPSFTA